MSGKCHWVVTSSSLFCYVSGYTIHRCGLGCRPQLHYHCVHCQSMLLRKEDFEKHLVVCKAKQPTASSATPPSEACPVKAETCTPLSEPCAEPADPGVHALQRRGRVRPVVRTKCPVCSVLMNKRNIGKHIVRKHTNMELFDVNATYQCIDEVNGIFAVQKAFHGHSVPLCVENDSRGENSESSESQECQENTDLAWRNGMRSHRCVQLRSVTFTPSPLYRLC